MRIFISYRHTGTDLKKLKTFLKKISQAIESQSHHTFVFLRDVGPVWEPCESIMDIKAIMQTAFQEIKKSDVLLTIVTSNQLSEGMIMEIGFALALDKQLFLAIKNGKKLTKTNSLAHQVISFSNTTDLLTKLSNLDFSQS